MSVQKRMRGGKATWVVRWRESGRGSRQHARVFTNRADAEAFDVDMRRQHRLGAFAATEPSSITLADWLDDWWDLHSQEWSANTRRTWDGVIRKWITPFIGGVRLRDLGTARVTQWRGEILEAGAPTRQTNQALTVLGAALGRAHHHALIPANPCAGVRKVGRPMPTRPRALTPTQIEAIRRELPTQADRVAWGLMALAGLRPSEAMAVRWDDLQAPILVVDATKTLRRRAVEVIPPLQDDIDTLRGETTDATGTMCTSPTGGPVNLHNWRVRVFLPACERAGVKATPYNGRTSYCSLLIHEGRSLAYVAASMGNSARVISDHYLHVLRAAELGIRTPMTEAVSTARNTHRTAPGVRPVCAKPGRGHLRLVS